MWHTIRELGKALSLLNDPGTPRAARWAVIASIVYLLSPIDILPDVLPPITVIDDLIVLAAAARYLLQQTESARKKRT